MNKGFCHPQSCFHKAGESRKVKQVNSVLVALALKPVFYSSHTGNSPWKTSQILEGLKAIRK